ncbi:hypothetical protein [Lactiplantibacillus plantarum]|nr:hypothetical protein [Lactiplantibacillus plantarum]
MNKQEFESFIIGDTHISEVKRLSKYLIAQVVDCKFNPNFWTNWSA